MSAPVIALVAPRHFLAANDGGRIKTASLCSALQHCGELHVVVTDNRPHEGHWFHGELLPLPFGGQARFWSCVPRATWLVPLWCKDRRLRRWTAARRLASLRPDIVIADDVTTTRTAFAGTHPRVVCHAHNAESHLYRQTEGFDAETQRRRLRRAHEYEAIERAYYPRATEVWGVRSSDIEYFESLGIARGRIVPNTLPEDRFCAPSVGRAGEVLFFGSLWWPPNVQAVDYLARAAVTPRVVEAGLRISIAGQGRAGDGGSDPPGLRRLGFVEDLQALARDCAVVAIPLTSGGGTKLKTIEALAMGKPVVTTAEGAAGLDLVDGRHVLIRDIGPAFDEAMIEVALHPQRYLELAREGQAWVRERFSQAAVDRIVRQAFSEMGLAARPTGDAG